MPVFPLRTHRYDAASMRNLAAEMRAELRAVEDELLGSDSILARRLTSSTRTRALAVLTESLLGTADRLDAEAELHG